MTEQKISKDIKNQVNKLNGLLRDASKNDIDVDLQVLDITEMGSKSKTNLIIVEVYKKDIL